MGIEVGDLSREDRNRLGVDKGVLVRRVSVGPGRRAGIRRGDVITTINSQWVESSREFETLIQDLAVNVAVPVRIVRDQRPQFLVIKIVQ